MVEGHAWDVANGEDGDFGSLQRKYGEKCTIDSMAGEGSWQGERRLGE